MTSPSAARERSHRLRALGAEVMTAPDLDSLARLLTRTLPALLRVREVVLLLWNRRLDSFETVSTVDLHVDYLEPAGLGAPLRAEAQLIRKGNRVCHVRVSVTQDGLLVAEGRGVYNIHRRSGNE